jgi:hypothetical protein
MAKSKQRQDLVQTLRAGGLRKKVARSVAAASENVKKGKTPPVVKRTVANLRAAATELERRVDGGASRRSAAAKKAAATRKRDAAARSASARKGARTRARKKS